MPANDVIVTLAFLVIAVRAARRLAMFGICIIGVAAAGGTVKVRGMR